MLSLTQEKRACRLQEVNTWFWSRLFIVFIITRQRSSAPTLVDEGPSGLTEPPFCWCSVYVSCLSLTCTKHPDPALPVARIFICWGSSRYHSSAWWMGPSVAWWETIAGNVILVLPDCHICICYYLYCIRVLVLLLIHVCVLVYHRVQIQYGCGGICFFFKMNWIKNCFWLIWMTEWF